MILNMYTHMLSWRYIYIFNKVLTSAMIIHHVEACRVIALAKVMAKL